MSEQGIRALTVRQPWAALIASGDKRWETRPMRTHYRGLLVIHAGAAWTSSQRMVLGSLPSAPPEPLVFGACLAVVEVTGCVEITPEVYASHIAAERGAGDWTPGRFAWRLEGVRRLESPIACRGQLGLWRLPPDVLAQVEAQL